MLCFLEAKHPSICCLIVELWRMVSYLEKDSNSRRKGNSLYSVLLTACLISFMFLILIPKISYLIGDKMIAHFKS